MLVLSRNVDESVFIGDNIVVTVLEAQGGRARIGISAPRSVDVHREEIILERARRQREQLALLPEWRQEEAGT